MTMGLTVLNLYDLKAAPEAFVRAIEALAARVEAEGEPGVLSYRFYVNAAEGTARGVVDYAGAEAWVRHHEIAMDWPQMRALHAEAVLREVTFLGSITPQIRDWLTGSTLTARVVEGYAPAGGFDRMGTAR